MDQLGYENSIRRLQRDIGMLENGQTIPGDKTLDELIREKAQLEKEYEEKFGR